LLRFNVLVSSVGYRGIAEALDALSQQIQLTKSQHLSLPLRFVFDEIASIIQQALPGSHPTGKITFARLGTLRPLPYRLIVMMNLDAGVFPSRDFKNTFDLIEVFPARKGDRSRQEDDRGAFMDGLLLAKEACWFFYNGFDVKDPHPRQPSGTLQEFMDFIAAKLIDSTSNLPLQQLPRQLWHLHQLQPFDAHYFSAESPISFEGIWSTIATQIQQKSAVTAWANQPIVKPDSATQHLAFRTILRQLANPAAHYLSAMRIRQITKVDSSEIYEPLNLNNLQQYHIRAMHQQHRDSELPEHQLQDVLPIGSAASAFWKKIQLEAEQNQQRLAAWGGQVNPLTEHTLEMGDFSLTIQIALPLQADSGALISGAFFSDNLMSGSLMSGSHGVQANCQCTRWVAQYPYSVNAKRLLIFWLEHLAWQVWRNTTSAQVGNNDGSRVAVYSKSTLTAPPIEATQARAYLQQWLEAWQQAAVQPWVLPPSLILSDKGISLDKNDPQVALIKDLNALHDIWLGRDFDFFGRNPQEKEECALHPDWQMILRGQDVIQLLSAFIEQYAIGLYQPLKQYVEELKQ
jgi:exodeoxyribonuclease V gamma subunit